MSSFSWWRRPPKPLAPAVTWSSQSSSSKPASKLTPKLPGLLWEASENGTYPAFDQGLAHDTPRLLILDPQACKICRKISISALIAPTGFKHHSTEEALLSSANSGCRLCLWVCSALFFEPWLEGKREKRAMRAQKQDIAEYQYPPILRYSQNSRGIRIVNPFEATERNILRVYTNSGDPASSVICARRIHNISSVENTLSRFSRHLRFADAPMTSLPRRVIDVGKANDEMVKLRDFGDKSPASYYICLSHRWQRSCPSITTQSNIEMRMKGIAIRELSATLRDAVLLTRALNVRYLWIDSLCILQDSNRDWELESSRMGAYYGRSWLTLAAGLDDQSNLDPNSFYQDSSIFAPRYRSNVGAGYYRLRTSGPDVKSDIYFNLQDELEWDNRGSSFLFTRGWTLQEEALSPRLLSFQPRQTSLRIGKTVYHESGLTQNINETSFVQIDGNIQTWPGLIEDYSQRLLSREGDKLPALSGIARLYQETCNSVYLAGLWFSALLEQLCWYVPSSGTETFRPSSYRAPSWSWASLDGKVVFGTSQISPRPITILHAFTTPAGRDPLGQVREGGITLQAQMNRQRWKRDSTSKGKWYYVKPIVEHGFSPTESTDVTAPFSNATLLLDIQDWTRDDLELWSLPIHDQFALALQVVDRRENIFSRIGSICRRSKQDDVDSYGPNIITII